MRGLKHRQAEDLLKHFYQPGEKVSFMNWFGC